MKRSKRHYERFHCTTPGAVQARRLWVPGGLVLVGPAIDIGYGIREKASCKDGNYVHDFEGGVKMYRRARRGEKPDLTYKSFPRDLMVLGNFLGCTYKDDAEESYEVLGSSRIRLCCTPDQKRLVAVHTAKGVLFLFKGGRMKVTDWIRR